MFYEKCVEIINVKHKFSLSNPSMSLNKVPGMSRVCLGSNAVTCDKSMLKFE